jgi:hypothetical protein
MRFERFPIVLALLLTLSLATAPMFGQSLTTGNITGTVVDPSRAVVANAPVRLKSLDTGSTASTTTSANGSYSFSLLKPGRYQITVKQSGFSEVLETADVEVGQTSKVDIGLEVAKGTEIVEVTGTAPLINTEPSSNTSFTQEEVAQLPSAGGDITNIADTAPGVVVNGTMGYGNFTANGMPATSNLFTINGENDMDPYFNINNSGASNLTLGQNEIGEATVITNPYGGQYGQLAGAQVTYVTKSGTNAFHGNAMYWWNGRLLNANDWMNIQGQEAAGQPNKPGFSNANQWATSFGGPIIKNKTFFFVDYEGMRFILPNQDFVVAPTPQFAAAVAGQTAATNPSESATMNQLLGLWTKAPLYNTATPFAPVPGDSCTSLTFAAGVAAAANFTPGVTPCSQGYAITPTALAWEYILSVRVDQKLGNKDNVFGRYKLDHGLQPTHIDPINSLFDANSLQPAYDAQASETHVFNANMTNSFTATVSHYVAQFIAANSVATFNYGEAFNEDQPIYNYSSPNAAAGSFPQGRNITQYQFIDDISWTHGNHTFKFGENFRRYDVSDHNFFGTSPEVYWGYGSGLQGFANGEAFAYGKQDNPHTDVPIAMWGIGAYAQDEWKAARNLKLTLALRLEHNSNPVCQINCFANLTGPFYSTNAYKAGTAGSLNVPYSADINYNQHNAYPGVNSILPSPRVGFSWDPRGNGKTVLSGGIGLFYDNPAAGMVDNLLGNPPVSLGFLVLGGVLPFTPSGAPNTWQQAVNAFSITDSYNQIAAALPPGVPLSPPSIGALVGTINSPEWTEYNVSVQQEIDRSTVFIINYAGNHGARISYFNHWPNAYDQYGATYTGSNGTATLGVFGTQLPLGAPPAASYAEVTEFRQGAVSNYNGLTFSLRRQFSNWVSAHLNYTWSHNLDEGSNGGIFNYGFEGNNSILGQIYPTSLRQDNYGNSDYDVRHLVNADFVVNPAFHKTGAMKWVTEGWQFSGKMFWRTGLPFTIGDSNIAALGPVLNGGSFIGATVTGNAQTTSCGKGSASYNGLNVTPCLNAAGLLDTSVTENSFACYLTPNGLDPDNPNCPLPTSVAYSLQRRNQYRGPHYFDFDLNLFKNFKIAERLNMAIGAQAFNAFNHPNFALPNANFATGSPTFGSIQSMQGVPTSPYGNFLGFDSSPRVMQVSMKIVF